MKAHELLADKSKWTQGENALDAAGDFCQPLSEFATCFCAFGALCKCYGDYWHRFDEVMEVVRRRYPGYVLSEVNDQLGYEAVMQVLREADV